MNLLNRVSDFLSVARLPESRRFWVTTSAVVLAVEFVLSIVFWDWLSGDESGSTTIRNIGLIMAGSVALPLAIWRGIVADKQAGAAQHQAETALDQANTAQRGLLNERYQQGAEMLGNNALSVRLGGIYALERLAAEHPQQYHVQIMKLLCAFVCNPTRDEDYEKKLAERNADPRTLSMPRQDVQAAIDAIGSRDDVRIEIETSQDFKLNLIGADLAHAQIGDSNLSSAMLHYANLSHTNIFSVDLSGAYLRGTVMKRVDLSDTDFTGARAWKVDLSGAMVRQGNKPLFDLDYAKLSPAQLPDGNLAPTHLFDVDLSGKSIHNAELDSVRISNSDLSDTHFLDTHFRDTDLSRAEIIQSNLSGASILRTDMSGVTLRDTDLSGVYFYDPDGGTATSPATGLTQAQLDEACADPDNPPRLDGVLDAETGKPLVWRGKPCKG